MEYWKFSNLFMFSMEYIIQIMFNFDADNSIVINRYEGDLAKYQQEVYINLGIAVLVCMIQLVNSILSQKSLWWLTYIATPLSFLSIFGLLPPFFTQDPMFLIPLLLIRFSIYLAISQQQFPEQLQNCVLTLILVLYDLWYASTYLIEEGKMTKWYCVYYILLMVSYLVGGIHNSFLMKNVFLQSNMQKIQSDEYK